MAGTNIVVDHATTGLITPEVVRAERISPHFVRITLGGDELAGWRHLGFDQWFRLALPVAQDAGLDRLSDRFDMRGYLKYLTMPKSMRPVIRNYTVREHRPGELDIDFVVHGTEGVAGPWAGSLPVGSRVGIIDQGCGFVQQQGTSRVLLAGDESALPAVLGILRDLPRDTTGDAIIEVPDAADQQPTEGPAGVNVHWVTRSGSGRPGTLALARLQELSLTPENLMAFVAGEQQLATGGRRHLVSEIGVPKTHIKFCGYWRTR